MNEDLTIAILTKNEEINLPRCLTTIPSGHPIVILDSGSTDKTLNLAEDRGCDIYKNTWLGFADQRNYALENCHISSHWTLFIDADEVFPSNFYRWFDTEAPDKESFDVVMVPSNLIFCGQRLFHAPGYPIYHPRLVRTKKVRFINNYAGHGETISQEYRSINSPIPYDHYIFDGDLLTWMNKHVMNAAKETRTTSVYGGKMTRRAKLNRLIGPSIFRVMARFFYHYFWCRGFLDGSAGFNYSLMYSWYEMTKYVMSRANGWKDRYQ